MIRRPPSSTHTDPLVPSPTLFRSIIRGPVDSGTVAAGEDPVSDVVADLAATTIATSAVPLDGTRAAVRTRETNLGNLVADSLLWQGRQLAGSFGLDQPVIALQNGGGIRNDAVIQIGRASGRERGCQYV